MVKYILIFLLFYGITATGATYQIANQTAFNSFNFSSLVAGDHVQFSRGQSYYGTITISQSGTSGNPITFEAYGTGANPIITGFTTISGWTNEGNGIYSKVITSDAQTNMVTIDGVNTPMGRTPNSTYLTYESCVTNTSITDTGLGASPNWTGAEIVVRKNDWTLDRCLISNHSDNVLTYTNLGSSDNATATYGYFIQNDLKTLDLYSEWYHNTSTGKFYMYFGGVDPNTKTVKVATKNNLIYDNGNHNYVTIDGLSLVGSINAGIQVYGTSSDAYSSHTNWTVKNTTVYFSGFYAVQLQGNNDVVDNNTIENAGISGIKVKGTGSTVTKNTIKNIGIIPGQSNNGSNNCGIILSGSNHLAQYNNIENVGYDGILADAGSNNTTIKNNYINNPVLLLNDGGGIYTYGTSSNLVIDGNIILNCTGNATGTPYTWLLAEGIYLDEHSNGITIQNNTIANSAFSGIKLHKAHDNTILNNALYNNKVGIIFQNGQAANNIYNINLSGNTVVAKTDQFAIYFNTVMDDIASFGTAFLNYYLLPTSDSYSFYTTQPNTGEVYRTLSSWKTFTSQDSNSIGINRAGESDNRFEYNFTSSNKTIRLSQPMVDVKGVKYATEIVLQPYTSAILIKDNNPLVPIVPFASGGSQWIF